MRAGGLSKAIQAPASGPHGLAASRPRGLAASRPRGLARNKRYDAALVTYCTGLAVHGQPKISNGCLGFCDGASFRQVSQSLERPSFLTLLISFL